MNISSREQKIIKTLLRQSNLPSSKIYEELLSMGDDISLVTVKRALSEMVLKELILKDGSGRSSSYEISTLGRIFSDIKAVEYCSIEPDRRYGQNRYNHNLFPSIPDIIFSTQELEKLETVTAEYHCRIKNASPVIEKKELERLIIELSWKSSKIEGNTYTLLETEKLILENKEVTGHTQTEKQMILNHKDAFIFVHNNSASFKILSRPYIE